MSGLDMFCSTCEIEMDDLPALGVTTRSQAAFAPNGGVEDHPTQFPVGMRGASKQAVFRMNHASTFGFQALWRCMRSTGRKFIGIEREPKYFDIACRRIDDAYRHSPAHPAAESSSRRLRNGVLVWG